VLGDMQSLFERAHCSGATYSREIVRRLQTKRRPGFKNLAQGD